MRVLSETKYSEIKKGYSLFSGDPVEIIGEQIAELDDGRVVEQYLYNIVGHKTKNGLLFISLKSNIVSWV
jgi:hypothetical protein